jgi:4-hydroxy-3-methylbut-2-en-1-yl diphosphate reductase
MTQNFLPQKTPVNIVLTSGASCPDTLVDRVMLRILDFYNETKPVEAVLQEFR